MSDKRLITFSSFLWAELLQEYVGKNTFSYIIHSNLNYSLYTNINFGVSCVYLCVCISGIYKRLLLCHEKYISDIKCTYCLLILAISTATYCILNCGGRVMLSWSISLQYSVLRIDSWGRRSRLFTRFRMTIGEPKRRSNSLKCFPINSWVKNKVL